MIVRSVELQSYGPFTNKTFEFRRGLNLVYGANETGKTTLLDSIGVALFGHSDGKQLRSWGLEGNCRVTLLLEGDGNNVRVLRDVENNRVSFLRTDDMYRTLFRFEGDPTIAGEDERKFAEQVTQIFGLDGVETFEDVLTFQQNRSELYRQGTLCPRTLALFKGDVSEVRAKAIDSLTREYAGLTRFNPWGEDLEQDGELESLRSRLKDLEEDWHARQESLKELSRVRRERATLSGEIEYDEEELVKGERFLQRLRQASGKQHEENPLERELAEVDAGCKKIHHLLRRRQDLIEERAALDLGETPDYEIPALAEEAEEARRSLHQLQNQAAALREELIAETGPSWLFPVGATIAFLSFSVVLALWHSELAVFSFFSAALLSAFGWIIHFWMLGSRKTEIGAKKERMLAIDEEREKAQLRLTHLDERLQQAGLPVSAKELQALQHQFTRHRDIELELREIASALSVLDDLEILEDRRRSLAEKVAAEGGIVATDGGAEPLGPEEIEEAEQRLQGFSVQLEAKKEKLGHLENEVQRLLEEVRDLSDIERQGEYLRKQEMELDERLKVTTMARDMLTSISDNGTGANLEKLTKSVCRHLRKLTNGRHRNLQIGAGGEVSLQARGGQWVSLCQFGRATIDAAGLALRLGMAELLFRGRSVSLLLDEPLVNFDHQRMDETLKQLEKVAAEHQVILFSHHEALMKKAAKAGWNLVTLNGKEKRSAAESERRTDDEQQLHLL